MFRFVIITVCCLFIIRRNNIHYGKKITKKDTKAAVETEAAIYINTTREIVYLVN